MYRMIKDHWIAIVLAVVLGLMTGLPQIVAIERLGSDFQGIYPTNNDDELYYLARTQEVLDGHTFVAQPYLWEGKERLPLQFWVPDVLLAAIAKTLGTTPQKTFIVLDFILPAIEFLLVYAIALLLSRNAGFAIAAAILLHFGMHFSLFNRPNSPQLNFIFLLMFVLASIFWVRKPNRKLTLAFGGTLGLLFHVYAYYWTYAIVAMGLALVAFIFQKDRVRSKELIVALGVAFLIGLPYFVQLYYSFGYEFYHETVARVGMIRTHMPSGISIVVLAGIYGAMLIALRFMRKIDWNPETILVSALVFASPIVTNQHLVTGENLEFSSHYRWLASFVSVFGCAYLLGIASRSFRMSETVWRLGIVAMGAVIGWSFFVAGATAYAQSFMRPDEADAQRYAPVLAWFREHAERDAVIYAPEELSRLIPAYTSQNVFYAREANLHYLSDDEVRDRFLISRYFDPPLTEKDIPDIERSVWGTYYINRWQHAQQLDKPLRFFGLSASMPERFPRELISALLEEDKEYKLRIFGDLLAPYRVDYIVRDTKRGSGWQRGIPSNLHQVAEIGDGFVIYRAR